MMARKLLVVPLAADVAGIDAVLGQGARAVGIAGEQQVAVVVEVADDGDARRRSGRALRRSAGTAAAASSVLTVTRTSSLPARASAATCRTVDRDVGRVGVGHGLHDDRMPRADGHAADGGGDGGPAQQRWHAGNITRPQAPLLRPFLPRFRFPVRFVHASPPTCPSCRAPRSPAWRDSSPSGASPTPSWRPGSTPPTSGSSPEPGSASAGSVAPARPRRPWPPRRSGG